MVWRLPRGVGVSLALVAVGVLPVARARAQSPSDALLFRIVLLDGRALTSFGDFARVGDRVVFSLPLGEEQGTPRLHLATVPADRIDWPATDRYREAVRASHYAATRGDEDFAAMTSAVAAILNDIAHTPDKARQLQLAEQARQQLAEWPRDHYGYRRDDVRQILSLLDEVVSELRAARGESRFDLAFVASSGPPPPVPLQPPPTLQESIAQALTAARLAESPGDRISLLRSAVTLLDRQAEPRPTEWTRRMRTVASRELAREVEITRTYGHLRSTALTQATRAAARADVRAVERVLADVRRRDAQLGSRRPDEVAALLAAVEDRLDAARRLRLARDQWEARAGGLRSYRDAVKGPFDELTRNRRWLDDIRTLAGPDTRRLAGLVDRMARVASEARTVSPPADAQPVHAVLLSALQLADNAIRLRQSAILSGNLQVAWDASAAAAGAVMLADRARGDLDRMLQPPALQ